MPNGQVVVRIPVIDDNQNRFYEHFSRKYFYLNLTPLNEIPIAPPCATNYAFDPTLNCWNELIRQTRNYLYKYDLVLAPGNKVYNLEICSFKKMIDFLEGDKEIIFNAKDYYVYSFHGLKEIFSECPKAKEKFHALEKEFGGTLDSFVRRVKR